MTLQNTLTQIDLMKAELQSVLPLSDEIQEKLDKKFRLEFQYNTNHLEGNTLTYAETELLLIFGETRGSHSLREHEEMKGSDVAYELVRDLATDKDRPLTEIFIKNLNQVLLVRPYWKVAVTAEGRETQRKITVGDYKKFPNSVLLENGETFHYASPIETPQLMGDLIDWFNQVLLNKSLHPVEIAANFHYKFVRIHPFDDGNGRVSRLLMNYVLLYYNFPPIIIKSDDKTNYLRALRDADTGNLESFILYLARQLFWSLDLTLKAANNESIDEQEDWLKNLSLLKRDLASKEGIKVKKNAEVIREIIISQILPFAQKLETKLTEFSELFLANYFYYHGNTSYPLFHIEDTPTEDTVAKQFTDNLTLLIGYNEFRKKIDAPFDVQIGIDFLFGEYQYSVVHNNQVIFSNLYHEPIEDSQFQRIINVVGTFLVEQIRFKLK